MACIEHGGTGAPDPIIDTSTLTLSIDNQGIAILGITILKKSSSPITNPCVKMSMGGVTFDGYLESDTPRQLEGTEYFEHNIVAKGTVC